MRLNEMFIFPFEEIEKGSNIIIYGMGSVGRCFYNQVTKLNYCNVLAIADKSADKFTDVRYDIVIPEKIVGYTYDYIVIAVASSAVAEHIKRDLVTKWNVKKEKVVFASNRKVPIHLADTDLNNLLDAEDTLRRELYAFSVSKDGDIAYFSDIINEMFKIKAKHDEQKVCHIKSFFIHFLKNEKSVKNQIVILRILYLAGYFDKELLEIYIKSIHKFKNFDARMWLLYDISVIERNEQSYRYRDFYLDKRKVMQENAFHYWNPRTDDFVKDDKENNRVAIVTFSLGDATSSHNGLIVPYANEMVRQGKEVVVFPVDLFRYRYGECFIQPLEPLEQNSAEFCDAHKEMFSPDVRILYNYGDEMEDRIHDFMQKLCDYSPSVVYDFSGEYAFLSPLYEELFPVIALPMRGYASSACFDVYMCRSKEICIKENAYYQSIKEEQMVESLVCSLPQKAMKVYRRETYGIGEEDFVITTVGNRLKTELTVDFVDSVCGFLSTHSNACWILVGGKVCDYIHEKYSLLIEKRQIIEWGYEEDLIGFYGLCNVYWNPNRMGAGGSIGSAMRCGIPIVTTTFPSDVLPRLGVENAVDGDYADCTKYMESLYEDAQLYEEKSELMQARMKISGVPEYVSKLLIIGEELCRKKRV